MGLPTSPLDKIISYGRAFFRTSFPGFPMGVKQFFGLVSRGLGLNAWSVQKSIEDLDADIVPNPNSSTEALDQWAFTLGLPSGADGYGRLVPKAATGGLANPTGVLGTSFPDGALAVAEDGTTIVKVSGTQTIAGSPPGSGSVQVNIVAVTTGSVGNLAAGTVCSWQSAPPGADPTFTLTYALSGGIDTETNAALYARIVLQGQDPPVGGNTTDITDWAEEGGAVGVFVYPVRSGTGTVDALVTVAGTGISRVPSNALVESIQADIDEVRAPGAEGINVMAPSTNTGHIVVVRVIPNGDDNAFDWGSDAPGIAYTVDTGGYSAGPPATIRLAGLAPASLKNAIQAYVNGTGTQPRLQVLSTGGNAVNPPIGTSRTVTWSDAGGKTTITLDTVPNGWTAPSSGDTIYPYGPVVPTIASAIVALCDSLGPSRQSGYGSTVVEWNDTLSINQITRVAEDASDANGDALIDEVLAGGATIDGSSFDVEGADNTVTAPELLFLSHVAVTA